MLDWEKMAEEERREHRRTNRLTLEDICGATLAMGRGGGGFLCTRLKGHAEPFHLADGGSRWLDEASMENALPPVQARDPDRRRERFEAAVAAMQGLLAADAARFVPGNLSPMREITKAATRYADALLARLDGEVSDE